MSPVQPTTRPTHWLLWSSVLLAALLALLMLALYQGLAQLPQMPVNVVINGESVLDRFDIAALPPAHRVVLALGGAVAVLTALVVVPLALLAGLAAVVVGVLLGVGLPLALAGLLVAIALSPLVAVVALLVWALRRRPAATRAATMAA